jgi:hypothetical protein
VHASRLVVLCVREVSDSLFFRNPWAVNHNPRAVLFLYSYVAELEFNVKKNGQFAPSIVVKILAKLVLDNVDIVFVDGTFQHITVDDFPTSKADFDDVFCTTPTNGKLSCKFKIQSSQSSFHAIKIGVWDLLQQHQVWFKRAPGPVKKTPLVAIGFWMNLHLGFISPRVFYTQLIQDIEEPYEQTPQVIAEFRLPTAYVPIDLYLSQRKIHAEYTVQNTARTINTEAFMTYAAKDQAELAHVYLTQMSSFRNAKSPIDPMYIPLSAKYNNPATFG